MEQPLETTDDVGLIIDERREDETVPRDTRVEALIESWGLRYDLEEEVSLGKLRVDDATQIRLKTHRAPTAMVEQYVTHMRHGAIFPPIVISTNGMLVDGNTRLRAREKLGYKTIAAYRVKFPHLGMARLLGAALNQMGGDRLTEEEIVLAAEAMMAEKYNDEAIARALGCSGGHVRNLRRDRSYREAAERTGLTHVALPKATQRVLAGIQHDEPFKAAVELVRQAKPSPKDLTALVGQIDKTRSDAEAIAAIQQVGQQWGPVAGPPPEVNKRSVSRSQGKKAYKALLSFLAIVEHVSPADLVLEDDKAKAAWQRASVIVTQVNAIYVKP